MKKYKLQHQMPDFQSVDEISLKKSIESMIKIIEIKINTTRSFIDINIISTIMFTLGGTCIIRDSFNTAGKTSNSSIIPISIASAIFLIGGSVLLLKKSINNLSDLNELKGKLTQLSKDVNEYSSDDDEFNINDNSDEILDIEKTLTNIPKTRKLTKKK